MAGKLIAGVENTALQQNTVQALTCALRKWTITAVKRSKEGAGGGGGVWKSERKEAKWCKKLLLSVSLGA